MASHRTGVCGAARGPRGWAAHTGVCACCDCSPGSSGNRVLVSRGAEELWGDVLPPPGPLGAHKEVVRALPMWHFFTLHRYTRGTLMTPATRIMPGSRRWPSVSTSTTRTMWR